MRRAPCEASNPLAALRIWGEALDARGTLAETYLFGRGLELDDRAREAVRFHPALRFDNGTAPAMVALLRDLRSDEPCGVHRTFLDRDGRKLERRMLGRARGAAVKLDPDDAVTLGLVVGEGIETCLAARQLGYRPCWALGSAQAIAKLPVLGGIEGLTMLGENDDDGANAQAPGTAPALARGRRRRQPARTLRRRRRQRRAAEGGTMNAAGFREKLFTAADFEAAPEFSDEALALEFAERHRHGCATSRPGRAGSSGPATAGQRTTRCCA